VKEDEENPYKKDFENEKENYDLNILKINKLVVNTGLNIMIVNRLDYYGNSIPLGDFL